jgi:hypothetical protein
VKLVTANPHSILHVQQGCRLFGIHTLLPQRRCTHMRCTSRELVHLAAPWWLRCEIFAPPAFSSSRPVHRIFIFALYNHLQRISVWMPQGKRSGPTYRYPRAMIAAAQPSGRRRWVWRLAVSAGALHCPSSRDVAMRRCVAVVAWTRGGGSDDHLKVSGFPSCWRAGHRLLLNLGIVGGWCQIGTGINP